MKKEFKLPNLGENIASGEVIKLLVAIGDKLEKEQAVIEISSDKATIEVPSDVSGIIKEIKIKEGDSIKPGQVLLTVETDEATEAPSPQTSSEEEPEAEEDKKQTGQQPTEEKKVTAPTDTNNQAPVDQKKAKPAAKTVNNKFSLPNLGENISSAEILKVMVAVGDKLEKEQSVIEISSDKATLEVPSDVSGIIKEINVKAGDTVKEGQLILTVESAGEITEEVMPETSPAAKPENKTEVSKTEQKTEPQTTENQEPVKTEKPVESVTSAKPKEIAPATPSVRRFAREIGIDIGQISGTGPGGRISVEDVKAYLRNLNKNGAGRASGTGAAGYTETLPDFAKWGEIVREPMNNIRLKTAQHLGYAWATIPHVTHFEKADITELEKLRKSYGKKVELAGGKLTMTSILLKIIASALKVFPKFNASIDLEKKEIIYKKYIHLGLAVDTDRGLLVPVIRDVDRKNITEISVDVGVVAEKARNKKITLEEMQGAGFTISNLGGIGGVGFTPVVNAPEVAILGVSQSSYEPVYQDGQFVPRLIMPFSLSYDHRLIDGADAARFMKWVKEAIENPFLLILEG